MGLFASSSPETAARPKKRKPKRRSAAKAPAEFEDIEFDLPEREEGESYKNKYGGKTTTFDDGSVEIDLEPDRNNGDGDPDEHDANLADAMEESDLNALAETLIMGIDADIISRGDLESMAMKAITMCGLKIEEVDATADGNISKVHHSLMIESTIRYQSNAVSEMLPASGPVKVRDDQAPDAFSSPTAQAGTPMMGHNGGPPMDDAAASGMGDMDPSNPLVNADASAPPVQVGLSGMPAGIAGSIPAPPAEPEMDRSALADAFEMDMNHYLTCVAKEYYPDYSRMLFAQGLFGSAFKKIYHCPLRRRPVSDYISMLDLIVSNDATDLYTAGRVTHRTKMRQNVMTRMQILGVYRDVDLTMPVEDPTNVEKKIKSIDGLSPVSNSPLPGDVEHKLYETYTEIDLVGYEHEEGLPLPYKITIEKDSRKILEIRRNWKEGDDTFTARRRFVKYGLIPGLGFYDYGYMHILGNTQKSLTAAERMLLDLGMFSAFPGFLMAKGGTRQTTTDMKVSPGRGKEIDTNGMPIGDAILPLPYKTEAMQPLMALAEAIAGDARALAGLLEIPTGEGVQNIPVGTMLALVEQSTKVMGAIHKRNHTSHQEELEILRELFAEDPEAIWKFSKKTPKRKWQIEKEFEDLALVPASDPNVPSHIHRIMIVSAVIQRADAHPELYDAREVEEWGLRSLGVGNIDKLLKPPPQPGEGGGEQQNPELQSIMVEAAARKAEQLREIQQDAVKQKGKLIEQGNDARMKQMELADRERDRKSKEKIALINAGKEIAKHKAAAHSDIVGHASTMEKTQQIKHKSKADTEKAKHAKETARIKASETAKKNAAINKKTVTKKPKA